MGRVVMVGISRPPCLWLLIYPLLCSSRPPAVNNFVDDPQSTVPYKYPYLSLLLLSTPFFSSSQKFNARPPHISPSLVLHYPDSNKNRYILLRWDLSIIFSKPSLNRLFKKMAKERVVVIFNLPWFAS